MVNGSLWNTTTVRIVNATNNTINNLTDQAQEVAVNASPGWLYWFFVVWIPTLGIRIWDIVAAPMRYTEMQWVILPLLATFAATETYFFRNVDEELGWNTAVVNSLVLIYVAIDLARMSFDHASPYAVMKLFWAALKTGDHLGTFTIVIFIALLGIALTVISFFHLLPKALAYKLASHVPTTFIAYTAIVLVYSDKNGNTIPLDFTTVLAVTIITTIVLFIMFTIQRAPGLQAIQRLRGGE